MMKNNIQSQQFGTTLYYTNLKLNNFFQQSLLTGMEGMNDLCQIVHYILQTSDLPGDIVEFGCFQGHVSKIISVVSPGKNIHVYDNFEGLPPGSDKDKDFLPGIMAASIESLTENFINDKIPLPVIHQDFFENLSKEDIPLEISFAYLDSDLYESIKCSLNLIYPNMIKGGIIMIDDYQGNEWPGVKLATDEFFADKEEKMEIVKKTNKVIFVKI